MYLSPAASPESYGILRHFGKKNNHSNIAMILIFSSQYSQIFIEIARKSSKNLLRVGRAWRSRTCWICWRRSGSLEERWLNAHLSALLHSQFRIHHLPNLEQSLSAPGLGLRPRMRQHKWAGLWGAAEMQKTWKMFTGHLSRMIQYHGPASEGCGRDTKKIHKTWKMYTGNLSESRKHHTNRKVCKIYFRRVPSVLVF
jgi:hypothetical protein